VSLPRENGLFRKFAAAFTPVLQANTVARGCEAGKSGAPVLLALNGFQTINLTVDLAAAPGKFNGGHDGVMVSPEEAIAKTKQRPDSGLDCIPDPLVHAVAIAVSQRLAEAAGERK
jgi:hypothetical protein